MKELLKNPWVVAGIIIVISAVVRLFVGSENIIGEMAAVIIAVFISSMYVQKFHEKMPGELKRNIVIIYFLVQVILTIFVLNQINVIGKLGITFIGAAVIINAVHSIFIYFALWIGGRSAQKALEKKAEKK